MQYKSVKGISGWVQLVILLAFTLLIGVGLTAAVQYLISLPLMPKNVPSDKWTEELMNVLSKPENVNQARLFQVLGTFCMLFVPAFLFTLVVNGRNFFWLGFNKYINYKQIIIAVVLIFLAALIAGPLAEYSRKMIHWLPSVDKMATKLENLYQDQVDTLSNLKSLPEFLISLVIMAFLPAMFEEIYFRGVLQNLLIRWWKTPLIAIIVSSIAFSAIHMSIYLFLSRAVLGFILGWMYYRSKNIWINIFAHFSNNAIALAVMFWYNNSKSDTAKQMMDPKVSAVIFVVALLITGGLFFVFEELSKKKRPSIEAKEQELLQQSVHHTFPEN